MKRMAFKMKLIPGNEKEYKKRHDEIWPDMVQTLKNSGIFDYSIYLDKETNTLFAFHKVMDDNQVNTIPENDIVKKWWAYMSDIMDTNFDNSPVITDLEEVFHMD